MTGSESTAIEQVAVRLRQVAATASLIGQIDSIGDVESDALWGIAAQLNGFAGEIDRLVAADTPN